MIIFDEKVYSERILNTGYYQTIQYQGQERRALARYLKYEKNCDDNTIKKVIYSIKSKRKEVYSDDVWDAVMSKVLLNYDKVSYIKDLTVGISQSELNVILSQPSEELQNLLFVLTVYYKWACNIKEKICMRRGDIWVKEADLDCCRLAGLEKIRKGERMALFNTLYKSGVYKSDYVRKYNNIFIVPFVDNEEPVIIVDTYTEILAHLKKYLNPKLCLYCKDCGELIYKTSNNKLSCDMCKKFRKHKKGE